MHLNIERRFQRNRREMNIFRLAIYGRQKVMKKRNLQMLHLVQVNLVQQVTKTEILCLPNIFLTLEKAEMTNSSI